MLNPAARQRYASTINIIVGMKREDILNVDYDDMMSPIKAISRNNN